jgi:hypothetical protein
MRHFFILKAMKLLIFTLSGLLRLSNKCSCTEIAIFGSTNGKSFRATIHCCYRYKLSHVEIERSGRRKSYFLTLGSRKRKFRRWRGCALKKRHKETWQTEDKEAASSFLSPWRKSRGQQNLHLRYCPQPSGGWTHMSSLRDGSLEYFAESSLMKWHNWQLQSCNKHPTR